MELSKAIPPLKNKRLTLCSPPAVKINFLKLHFTLIQISPMPVKSCKKSVVATFSDLENSFTVKTPAKAHPRTRNKHVNKLPICDLWSLAERIID